MTTDRTTWDRVDAHLDALIGEDNVLRGARAAADSAGLPAIHISPAQGKMLHLLARAHGARRALEVGTLAAYSTIWLARGLVGPDRHVTTVEVDPRHAAVAQENLEGAGLGDVVQVRLGRGVDVLAELADEGVEPFDLVFIDADKPSNTAYLEGALRLTRPGAVIVVDNVVRQGRLADDASTDESALGSRSVVARVADDPTLSGTVIQTVGVKGYDGFLLVVRD